jgi:hypothetical protein
VRRDLRRLRDDRRVEVADHPSPRGDDAHHVSQELAAVDVLPARIGVGEMRAEVAERERAEQRVADGVQQGVGIGARRGR